MTNGHAGQNAKPNHIKLYELQKDIRFYMQRIEKYTKKVQKLQQEAEAVKARMGYQAKEE